MLKFLSLFWKELYASWHNLLNATALVMRIQDKKQGYLTVFGEPVRKLEIHKEDCE